MADLLVTDPAGTPAVAVWALSKSDAIERTRRWFASAKAGGYKKSELYARPTGLTRGQSPPVRYAVRVGRPNPKRRHG